MSISKESGIVIEHADTKLFNPHGGRGEVQKPRPA
ncbi:hypothetical protein SAMN05518684_104237 [Salipaludibacillus aurantiacus]|uniref:Uncharacterized protein n=1 Tax=Salipaludibacillus aurantiacus TaxID=1601833 RepID=A0A1H9SI94_9BACI|nr:hypothetical protein SAMN05518684_104237 [Salipaludibacillus aurantiacus]